MRYNRVARADGFATLYDMYEWFRSTHGIPFDGQLVAWEVFEAVAEERVEGGAGASSELSEVEGRQG